MKHGSIDGVVIHLRKRETNDYYLTLLTAERGRIRLLANGGRAFNNDKSRMCQLYLYGTFDYYTRGESSILKTGMPRRHFFALGVGIEDLSLAAYLCELIMEMTDAEESAEEELRLLLNSLHAIEQGLYPREQIKAAFEMRLAAMGGYAPDLTVCAHCGKGEAPFYYLNVMSGSLICPDCLQAHGAQKRAELENDVREADTLLPASPSVLAALRYCIGAPLNRIFSFGLKEEQELESFSKIGETYLLSHLGRGFSSLDYYKQNLEEPFPMIKKRN